MEASKRRAPLRLDSLTGERDGTQQLLEAGEKSQRKEANANMENKLNAMSKKKVKEFEVCMGFGIVVDHVVRSFLQLFVSCAFYRKI